MELHIVMSGASEITTTLNSPLKNCTSAWLRSANIQSSDPMDTIFVTIDEIQNPLVDIAYAGNTYDVAQTSTKRAFAVIHNGSFETNGYNGYQTTFPPTNLTRLHVRLFQSDGVTPLTTSASPASVLCLHME